MAHPVPHCAQCEHFTRRQRECAPCLTPGSVESGRWNQTASASKGRVPGKRIFQRLRRDDPRCFLLQKVAVCCGIAMLQPRERLAVVVSTRAKHQVALERTLGAMCFRACLWQWQAIGPASDVLRGSRQFKVQSHGRRVPVTPVESVGIVLYTEENRMHMRKT